MGDIYLKGIKYGGGLNVVPNPQEEPTDTLSTIRIGDTVFDIAGSGGGYSETEFDTGMKWTDGKTIYGLIIPTWNSVSSTEYRYDLWRHNPTALIDYGGTIVTSGLIYFLPYNDGTNYATLRYNVNMGVLQLFSTIGAPGATVYVYFTK